jgi:DnaJ-class molecular chaperone
VNDIEECPECAGEGSHDESECCGANILGEDGICAKCFEHTQKAECVSCDGSGKIRIATEQEKRDIISEIKFDYER